MSRYAEVHKIANLRGPGDARPTALQIIADEDLTGKLTDKTFLITGVSSGLGIETLRALHTTGAHVYGTVRNLPAGEIVVSQILSEQQPGGGKISLIEMSLDSFASIRKAAQEFLSKSGGKLNAIIANAGVMACPFSLTVDGHESQFGINHLGHFLLFQLLKDALLFSATHAYPSRYISVTSIAHKFSSVDFSDLNYTTREYEAWAAYGQSKTANIWMANHANRLFSRKYLYAMSVHPGGIVEGSHLSRHIPKEQFEAMFEDEETRRTFKSAAQGAATQVWAAVGAEWKGRGGRYLASLAVQKSREVRAKEEGVFEFANEGYASWAYDREGEEALWKVGLEMVGLGELEQ
jgi:NAD(P)-dependent dehydrogenase (short-subunit alcohol dehydrogenase family)